MTDTEINIAIAEACGIFICPACNHSIDPEVCWCGDRIHQLSYHDNHSPVPMGCTCGFHDAEDRKALIPECEQYTTDLNACHEMESTIYSSDQWEAFVWTLDVEMSTGSQGWGHATARQRSEAFLRTLGLWKEDA